jgi:hypothetical protein
MGRSMTPLTVGNLIPTIIRDLPATFILPALSPLVSKPFSQSITDRKEMRKVAFDFASKFSMLSHG